MNMFPQSNQSLKALGMYTDLDKYLWIMWLMGILVVSVVGNSIVLIGSIKYKAIHLDKVTTVLIDYTAVSDLGLTATVVPTLVSLVADSMLYGQTVCGLLRWVNGLFVRSSCFLVTALNCSKLASLLWPFDAGAWSARKGHVIAIIVWATAGILLGFHAFAAYLFTTKTIFVPATIRCIPIIPREAATTWLLLNVEALLSRLLPLIAILSSTTWFLVILYRRFRNAKRIRAARCSNFNGLNANRIRATRCSNFHGVITVVSISVIFILSYAPQYTLIVYTVLTAGDTEKKSQSFLRVLRSFQNIVYINSTSNFFIYLASVRRFHEFVFSTVIPFLVPGRRKNIQLKTVNARRNLVIRNPLNSIMTPV